MENEKSRFAFAVHSDLTEDYTHKILMNWYVRIYKASSKNRPNNYPYTHS